MAAAAEARSLVVVDPSDVEEVKRLAAAEGVRFDQLTERALEPVSTVTLLLIGTALAVSTVVYLVDRMKGGQVIDLREGAPLAVYRTKDLVYGLVLIIAIDGSVTVEVKEPRGMLGEVLDAIQEVLTEVGKQGIGAIEQAINSRLSDRVVVKRGESLPLDGSQ